MYFSGCLCPSPLPSSFSVFLCHSCYNFLYCFLCLLSFYLFYFMPFFFFTFLKGLSFLYIFLRVGVVSIQKNIYLFLFLYCFVSLSSIFSSPLCFLLFFYSLLFILFHLSFSFSLFPLPYILKFHLQFFPSPLSFSLLFSFPSSHSLNSTFHSSPSPIVSMQARFPLLQPLGLSGASSTLRRFHLHPYRPQSTSIYPLTAVQCMT